MNLNLYFRISTGFVERSTFIKLVRQYSRVEEDGAYYWVVPVSDISKFLSIVPRGIEFKENDLRTAIEYCPPLKEIIETKGWKGVGKLRIEEFPNFYEVREFVKQKGSGEIKEHKTLVPIGNVKLVKKILYKFDRLVWIGCRKLARDICVEKHITDYIKDDHFDWQRFFGSRGKAYFPFYYFPIKVLEYQGFLEYGQGKVRRII